MLHGLASHVHKLRYILGDNSSTILSGVGVAGTIATAVLSTKATIKASALVAEEKVKINHSVDEGQDAITLSKTDTVKLVWRHYLPPVAAGSITIGCIIGANRISSKRVAALTIAAGVSERALSEYKDKVIERLGDRQDQKIRDDVAQDRVLATPANSQLIIAGSGEVLCFDMLTGRYFHSTMEDLKRAENKVNYELLHYDSCSLSNFYEEVGLEPTPYTDSVGWNLNNHMEVKFSTVLSNDNKPCIAIDFSRPPITDFDKQRNWG